MDCKFQATAEFATSRLQCDEASILAKPNKKNGKNWGSKETKATVCKGGYFDKFGIYLHTNELVKVR